MNTTADSRRWITVIRTTTCNGIVAGSRCGASIWRGERAFYDPKTQETFCSFCKESAR